MKFYNHPVYDEKKEAWNDYDVVYKGTRAELIGEKRLWMHEIEKVYSQQGGRILREIREQRTQYANLCHSIIRKYIAMLFNEEPNFTEILRAFPDTELSNVDGAGTSFFNYIKEFVAKDYFIFGKSVDLVDSVVDEQQALRPFLEHWAPKDLVDWQTAGVVNGQDAYDFARLIYKLVPRRSNVAEQPKVKEYTKVLKLLEGRYAIDIYEGADSALTSKSTSSDYEYIDTIETKLDFIPLAVLDRSSWIDPFYPQVILRHNIQSALDNLLNYQAHQRTYITAANVAKDNIVAHEASVVFLPEGSTVTIHEPCNPVALIGRLETVTMDIWRIAFFQNRVLNADSKVSQSADTLLESKSDLVDALVSAGHDIQDHVNNIVKNWAGFKGIKDFEGKVNIQTDFSSENLDDIVKMGATFKTYIDKYKTWEQELSKKVARKMNLENIDDVVDEIDAGVVATPPQWANPLQALLNGRQQQTEQES